MRMRLRRWVLALVVPLAGAGCSSTMHAAEGKIYASALVEELVRLNVCATVQLCRSEKRVTWRASGWKLGILEGGGVTVHVYALPDRRIADILVARCQALHAAMPKVPVTLAIHPKGYSAIQHPRLQVYTRLVYLGSRASPGELLASWRHLPAMNRSQASESTEVRAPRHALPPRAAVNVESR